MKTNEPKFKVFKVFKDSARRVTLARGLTRDEAKRMVNSFPQSTKSMVCFTQQ